MLLNIVISENSMPIDVPDHLVSSAVEMFDKMDLDMDKGWQMGREWVDNMSAEQRCQVVADRLLTALESENQNLQIMMAAYILNRMPGIKGVRPATDGEIHETELLTDYSQF